jgi:cell division protein FtsI (penicillin-binding protein 3)
MMRKGKLFTVAVLIIVAFFSLIWRLASLQIVQGETLAADARELHNTAVKVNAERGQIFDDDGNPLALNVPCYSVFWRRISENIEKDKLKKLFTSAGRDWPYIEEKIDRGARFIYLDRSADEDFLDLVKEVSAEGVEWKENRKRIYPCGQLASHILGFTGTDRGLEGVERDYEKYLRGDSKFQAAQRDARGYILPTLGKDFSSVESGNDIYLTIDKIIQHVVEGELAEVQKRFEPKTAVAIAMEPKTGKILALANTPSYDPNCFSEFPSSNFRNRAITDIFEPGSIFKIITAAAALEEEVVSPMDEIFCEHGSYRLAGHTIHDVHSYGWLTFKDALSYSSNIGFTKVGQRLGEEKLYKYIRKFGFGERTGIDLGGEITGLLRDLSDWSNLSIGAIPYGQEIGATPMQMISSVSAVANGGVLMKPFVVDRIVNKKGEVIKKNYPAVKSRVISQETSEILTNLLIEVVDNGTGKSASIRGYRIAGKTGTSQKYILGEGYSHSKFVSSFIGYAPAYDPRVVLLVMVDEPNGAYYGSQVAAPPFKNMMQRILRYLEIPPEEKPVEMAGL